LHTFIPVRQYHRHTRGIIRLERNFLDAGQHLMDALVERAGQHGVGDDRIEAFEVRDPRQQIPIGRQQAMRIECAVGDGQHDVPPGP
jgi:hypothetical protein